MNDARLELAIGRLLRAAVVVSSVCLAVGLLLDLVQAGTGGWVLQLGVLLLIAAPPSRVLLVLVNSIVGRDWRFAALTATVLVELSASVIAAIVFHRSL